MKKTPLFNLLTTGINNSSEK